MFAEHWIAAWNSHDLDRIMEHYEETIELRSPLAIQRTPDKNGRVVGKDRVRAYFQQGLEAAPNLQFTLKDVLWGVNSIVLYYINQSGTHAAEYMELSPRGKVLRMTANYNR
jgi:predicted ester cyclase